MKKNNYLPPFEGMIDLEKLICKYAITNPRDIAYLYQTLNDCIAHQDDDEKVDFVDRKVFHEGASINIYYRIKSKFEAYRDGVILGDYVLAKHVPLIVSGKHGQFICALNAKSYDYDEYMDRIRQFNLKRGLMLTDLDSTYDLCVADLDRACEGLKTYDSETVWGDTLNKTVDTKYYSKIIPDKVPEYEGTVPPDENNPLFKKED
jgi:hypothetical protein